MIMARPIIPAGVVEGKCHICQEEHALIMWCGACRHWLCGVCRRNPVQRAKAAVKELFKPEAGCCGPSGFSGA